MLCGKRVGRERGQRDEPPGLAASEMDEARSGRTRRAPHRRRGSPDDRARATSERDRGESRRRWLDIGERDAAQFLEQEPERNGHRREPDRSATRMSIARVFNSAGSRPDRALPCTSAPSGQGTFTARASRLPARAGGRTQGAAEARSAVRRVGACGGCEALGLRGGDAMTGNHRPMPGAQDSGGTQDYVGDSRNDDVLISVNGVLTPRDGGEGLGVRFRLRARRRRLGGPAADRRAHRLSRPAFRPAVGRRENAAHRHRPDARRRWPRGCSTSIEANGMRDGVHIRLMVDARRQALALSGPAPDDRRRDDRHHPRMEIAAAGDAGAAG